MTTTRAALARSKRQSLSSNRQPKIARSVIVQEYYEQLWNTSRWNEQTLGLSSRSSFQGGSGNCAYQLGDFGRSKWRRLPPMLPPPLQEHLTVSSCKAEQRWTLSSMFRLRPSAMINCNGPVVGSLVVIYCGRYGLDDFTIFLWDYSVAFY
jgi:hypothetical protein